MTDSAPLVLVIEDEPQVQRFLRAALTSHGYGVVEAGDAASGVAALTASNPRLILLDLGLPDRDGLDLTRDLRAWTRTPIIVLSARGREEDKVEALDAGADDYLTKPFGVNELLARMRVALRHTSAEQDEPVLVAGPVRMDLAKHEVTIGGAEIHLTPIEYRLLALLVRHRGKVLTHRHILKDVWGPSEVAETHYLRVYMAQLRRKIERDPANPKLLMTELGVGYRLRDPEMD